MIDYYGEYHQAQQEEARPNLCPECNGDGYGEPILLPYGTREDPPEYDTTDCNACLGTGTIDRPYTERDLWLDDIMYDTYQMITETERILNA